MNLFGFIPAGLLIVQGFLGAFSGPTDQIDVAIRIFAVPPIQSVTSAGEDGKGRIVGTRRGGDVTASFPGDGVVIRTDLDERAPEAELKAAIYEHGCFKAEKDCLGIDIGWKQIGMMIMDSFVAADGSGALKIRPAGAVKYENGGEELRYNLFVQTKSWDGENAVLNLKFELETWKDHSALENTRRTLLDQEVECSKGKILLVGFPTERGTRAGQSRGMVYFLAVTVRQDS